MQVGDALPDVKVDQLVGGEVKSVSLKEMFAGKKGVLFGGEAPTAARCCSLLLSGWPPSPFELLRRPCETTLQLPSPPRPLTLSLPRPLSPSPGRAVPGAFTPGCSKTHLPGYVADRAALAAAGAQIVACVSVNDPYVMAAWGEAHGAEAGGVQMLADTRGELTAALGFELDLAAMLGGVRCRR